MRRIPFVFKLSLSSGLAFYMCKKLWEDNIYEAELYSIAIRYRNKFDTEYVKQSALHEEINTSEGSDVKGNKF